MSVQSVSAFLKQAGIRFVVYDLGRRIQKLGSRQFARIENGQLPYPLPFQQHAWLGLVGWSAADRTRHFIWFVKLPLDELGLVSPTARDEVLHYLLDKAGATLLQSATDEPAPGSHDDLPHGFKPREESMAMFHARAAQLLGQPPSRYYAHARDYLAGKQGFDQWAFVGLQGLAEVVARLEEDDNLAILTRAIAHLPAAPLNQVCRFLEHMPIPAGLTNEIIRHCPPDCSNEEQRYRTVAAIRAMSASHAGDQLQTYLQDVLDSTCRTDIEVLAAISGRCWETLKQPRLAQLYLEALAQNQQGQNAFEYLLLDLLAIPGMREPLLAALRAPERSETLATAMGSLFSRLDTV